MKNKLITFISIIIASCAASSHAKQSHEPQCPSLNAIKTVGLNFVEKSKTGFWSAAQLNNNFGTNAFWTFYLTGFDATDAKDAMFKATDALTTLQVMGGPVGNGGMWICGYKSPIPNVIGYAVTPPMNIHKV